MDGQVILTNRERKIAAIRMKAGKYAVFKVLSDFNIDQGDIVTGKFSSAGLCHIANLTKRTLIKGDIGAHDCLVANKVKELVRYGWQVAS